MHADPRTAPDPPDPMLRARRVGLVTGIAFFIVLLALPAPQSMTIGAWRTAAVAVLMAVWWMTEAVPIAATAILPLVLFPLLGVLPIEEAAPPYANPTIFLFLGGFILATGLERSGLHRRIALGVLRTGGTRPANLVGGFMIATAAISMWVSNTATALMMLPIATSIITVIDDERAAKRLAVPLLLGIAWAANIGGLGTLIGTPPNALLAGFASETLERPIGFVEWMGVGVPIVVVAIPLGWLLLTRVLFAPGEAIRGEAAERMRRETSSLGRMTREEWLTTIVCCATAIAWIVRPLLARAVPAISDAGIAMTGGLLLLVVPVRQREHRFVIEWEDVERLPWGVLILFGGGISLATGIETTGLAAWTGATLGGLGHVPPLLLVLVVTTVVLFLGEVMSNTATAATFLPLVSSLATGFGLDPLLLAIPVTLASSSAFMLPVGTPPNALVYASGRLTIAQMMRSGIWMNLLMIVLIAIATFALAGPIFGSR